MEIKKTNSDSASYYYEDDELTLKDVLKLIGDYFKVVKKSLPIILGISVLYAVFVAFNNSKKPTTYTSAMTFIVGESQNSDKSTAINPFDQFQFDNVKEHRITEIARANLIVQKVLNASIKDKENQTIKDEIIETYELKDKWSNFINGENSDQEKILQNKLHEFLVGNKLTGRVGLMSISYADRSDIFTMRIKTTDPDLSSVTLERFFSELSEFYIDKTVGKYRKSFDALKIREDSLKSVLLKIESDISYSADRSRGVVSSIINMNQSRLQRKFDAAERDYNDLRSNRIRVEGILQKDTPDFQIIDKTFDPIVQKPSLLKSAGLAFMVLLFLLTGLVLVRHIIKKALQEE